MSLSSINSREEPLVVCHLACSHSVAETRTLLSYCRPGLCCLTKARHEPRVCAQTFFMYSMHVSLFMWVTNPQNNSIQVSSFPWLYGAFNWPHKTETFSLNELKVSLLYNPFFYLHFTTFNWLHTTKQHIKTHTHKKTTSHFMEQLFIFAVTCCLVRFSH